MKITSFFHRTVSIMAAWCLMFTTVLGPFPAVAQQMFLPPASSLISTTSSYIPLHVKGLRVDPVNPFQFEFLVDPGDSGAVGESLQQESTKVIKYFLASLTVPESDLWVNLSPYEQDRIIPSSFGLTEMGRDLLAQDYLLKQLTSSLMHPDEETGSTFWEKIHAKADAMGIDEVPVNTFNKVWIIPEQARVFEGNGVAVVAESRLKVMLENDYLALSNNDPAPKSYSDTENIIREVIIPVLEEEVNHGEHFAPLRQIYHSLILASWYKRKLRNSLLTQVYADQNKTVGVDHNDESAIDQVYQGYVESFKEGVYNFIEEEYDPVTQQIIPRKYFSGGFGFAGNMDNAMLVSSLSERGAADVIRKILTRGLLAATVSLVPGNLNMPNMFGPDSQRDYTYAVDDVSHMQKFIELAESGDFVMDFRLSPRQVANNLGLNGGFVEFYETVFHPAVSRELSQNGQITLERINEMAVTLARDYVRELAERDAQLLTFFEDTWSRFFADLANQRPTMERNRQRLLEEARAISPRMRPFIEELIAITESGNITSGYNDFKDRWYAFNQEFLIPSGYYATISPMQNDSTGQVIFSTVVYAVDRTESRNIMGQDVLTVYGTKIDKLNTDERSHSLIGQRFVFIDNEDVDTMARRISDTVNGEPYILDYDPEMHAPSVNRALRASFKNMDAFELRSFMERLHRVHEFAHQAEEIVGTRYIGTDDFGFSSVFWEAQSPQTFNRVSSEALALLAELLVQDDPTASLAQDLRYLTGGQASSYYVAIRWIFNRLDGRSTDDEWTDWRSPEELIGQFHRLRDDRNLKDKVRELIQENYGDYIVDAIETYDAAMLSSQTRFGFDIQNMDVPLADYAMLQNVSGLRGEPARIDAFFKGPWSHYVVSLANQGPNLQGNTKQLVQEAERISPELGRIMRRLTDMVSASENMDLSEVAAFREEWHDFNESYLIPRGFYSSIQGHVDLVSGRTFIHGIIYRLEHTESRQVNGSNVLTLYGRKTDRVKIFGDAAHNDSERGIVFIDLDQVDLLVDRVQRVLDGKPYPLNEGLDVSGGFVSRVVRESYEGYTPREIRDRILRNIRAHEYTHQAHELLGVEYLGFDNFGVPVEFINQMPVDFMAQVEEESLALLGQMTLSEDRNLDLTTMLAYLLDGEGNPYYFASRWIFNRLDGRENIADWSDWRDRNDLFDQYMRLAGDSDLSGKLNSLLVQSFDNDIALSLYEFDAAMLSGVDFSDSDLEKFLGEVQGQQGDAAMAQPYRNYGFTLYGNGRQVIDMLRGYFEKQDGKGLYPSLFQRNKRGQWLVKMSDESYLGDSEIDHTSLALGSEKISSSFYHVMLGFNDDGKIDVVSVYSSFEGRALRNFTPRMLAWLGMDRTEAESTDKIQFDMLEIAGMVSAALPDDLRAENVRFIGERKYLPWSGLDGVPLNEVTDRAMLGNLQASEVADLQTAIDVLRAQPEEQRDELRLAALELLNGFTMDDPGQTFSAAQKFLDTIETPFEDFELQIQFDATVDYMAQAFRMTEEEAQEVKDRVVVVSRQDMQLSEIQQNFLDLVGMLNRGLLTINDSLRAGRLLRSMGEEVDGFAGTEEFIAALGRQTEMLDYQFISQLAELIVVGMPVDAGFMGERDDYGRYVIAIDREAVGEDLNLALLAETGHAVFEVMVDLNRERMQNGMARRLEIDMGVHESIDVLSQLRQRKFTPRGDQARENGRILYEYLQANDIQAIRRAVEERYPFVSFDVMSPAGRLDKMGLIARFPDILPEIPDLAENLERDNAYISHMIGMHIAVRLLNGRDNGAVLDILPRVANAIKTQPSGEWLTDPKLFIETVQDNAMLASISVDDVLDLRGSIDRLLGEDDASSQLEIASLRLIDAFARNDNPEKISMSQMFFDSFGYEYEDFNLQTQFMATAEYLAQPFGLTEDELSDFMSSVTVIRGRQAQLSDKDSALLFLLTSIVPGAFQRTDKRVLAQTLRDHFPQETIAFPSREAVIDVLRKNSEQITPEFFFRVASAVLVDTDRGAHYEKDLADYGKHVINVSGAYGTADVSISLVEETAHAIFNFLVERYQTREGEKPIVDLSIDEVMDFLAVLMTRNFTLQSDLGQQLYEFIGTNDMDDMRLIAEAMYPNEDFSEGSVNYDLDRYSFIYEFPNIVESIPDLAGRLLNRNSVAHSIALYMGDRLMNGSDYSPPVIRVIADLVRERTSSAWLSDPQQFMVIVENRLVVLEAERIGREGEDAAMLSGFSGDEIADLDRAIANLRNGPVTEISQARIAALDMLRSLSVAERGSATALAQLYFERIGYEYEDAQARTWFNEILNYKQRLFGLTDAETAEVSKKVAVVRGRPLEQSRKDRALLLLIKAAQLDGLESVDSDFLLEVVQYHFDKRIRAINSREDVLEVLRANADFLTPEFFDRTAMQVLLNADGPGYFLSVDSADGRHVININEGLGMAEARTVLTAETGHAVLRVIADMYQSEAGELADIDMGVNEAFDMLSQHSVMPMGRGDLTDGDIFFEYLRVMDADSIVSAIREVKGIEAEAGEVFTATSRIPLLMRHPQIVDAVPDLPSRLKEDGHYISHALGRYLGFQLLDLQSDTPTVMRALAETIRTSTASDFLKEPEAFLDAMRTTLGAAEAVSVEGGDAAMLDPSAQAASPAASENVGGIDLNPANWTLESESPNGEDCLEGAFEGCLNFDLPDQQILDMRQNINGLVPVIINIQPVINMPMFLGINESDSSQDSIAYLSPLP